MEEGALRRAEGGRLTEGRSGEQEVRPPVPL